VRKLLGIGKLDVDAGGAAAAHASEAVARETAVCDVVLIAED
jgi:hypothetical protein